MAAVATIRSFPAHWPEWAQQFPAELELPESAVSRAAPSVPGKFKAASPFEYETMWPYQEELFPCCCCAATLAMEDGVWTCQTTQREWIIISHEDPHWGNLNEADFAAMRAAETPEQRAAREAASAKADKERELDCEASKMSNYAQHVGIVSTRKVQGQFVQRKVPKPCKWLYLNEKAPRDQWRKNEKGEWCAPMVRKLTGSQCWAWEYVHPKTKQRMTPHKCDHLHPGEAGWDHHWDTDRTYNPHDGFAKFGAARGVVASAPSGGGAAAPAPKPAPAAKPKLTNQWAALGEDNSAW